jgi:hypothetical protein
VPTRSIGHRIEAANLVSNGRSQRLRIAEGPHQQPHVPALRVGAELVKDRLVLAVETLMPDVAHHADDFQRPASVPEALANRILAGKVPAGHGVTDHGDRNGDASV